MSQQGISRRAAFARMLVLVSIAGGVAGAPGLVMGAGGQPVVPKKDKDKDKAKSGPKTSSGTKPAASGAAEFDRILTRGREHTWNLRVTVTVRAQQFLAEGQAPIIMTLKFATAAVVFPVNKGCASSEMNLSQFKGELTFNDALMDNAPKFNEGYACGTRLARWEMKDKEGREVGLKLDMQMTTWETILNEAEAEKLPWPTGTMPASAASALKPDAYTDCDPNASMTPAKLVQGWLGGKDPKAAPPVQMAKFLTGKVLEFAQPSGKGMQANDAGGFVGIELQPLEETIRMARGSEHDVNNLLCAVLRAAGLPARTVIGYDVSDKKGEDSKFLDKRRGSNKLRAWTEFYVATDEKTKKELWIPIDLMRLRKSSSRAPALNKPWKGFGSIDDLDDVMPFAFQYHPPTTVVAHGYPAFWGWFTTPESQVAEQTIRFDAITTSKRADDKDKKEPSKK